MLLRCTQAVCRYARERCFSVRIDCCGIQMQSPGRGKLFLLFSQFFLA
ncbi:uncharacterized protein J3R85_012672 [Psidium guajava]|nr:uncharacterized protein J3R85_012672 [Psidium guajava]